jgi:ABC transporter substrate binding protein (PQQ-dependent alcohol dehydrogenase system)
MRRVGFIAGSIGLFLALALSFALPGLAQTSFTPATGGKPPLQYDIVYLGKHYVEPAPLSFLDPVLSDNGVQGARLGVNDNNRTGQFLGESFTLDEHIIPPDADITAEAKKVLDAGHKLIIADLEPSDLLAVADMPEAKDALILDIRTSDDTLRQQQCRANVFHILPSWAMRADALAQYLIWKKWPRWFLMRGTAPGDIDYANAVKRAAKRFGGTVVEERVYQLKVGNNRTDTGHQEIQTQMPEATRDAPDYDVLWVADTTEDFGEYVPYRLADPRPVVGTQGLVAVAWHRAYQEYAGMQLQDRFHRLTHRWMTERDYGAWLGTRVIGEAALHSRKTTPQELRQYILSKQFVVAGDKGQGMTFRPWDNQLRQPILISGPRALVSISPQDGFLHPNYLTDTLGYDAPETKCRMAQR